MLTSDSMVLVEQKDDMIIFKPEFPITTRFIFYPGGKVEYTAYASLMYELAQQGTQLFFTENVV